MADFDLFENTIAPIISDLKRGRKLSFVIRKNLSTIQRLIDDGYSISEIHNEVDKERNCSLPTFNNAIYRARKTNSTKILETIATNNETSVSIKKIKENSKPLNSVSENSIDMWIKAFSFTTPCSVKALPFVVPILEKAGWNPNNYHLLKDKFSILTFIQLSSVVGNITRKKLIFKDGEAIF